MISFTLVTSITLVGLSAFIMGFGLGHAQLALTAPRD